MPKKRTLERVEVVLLKCIRLLVGIGGTLILLGLLLVLSASPFRLPWEVLEIGFLMFGAGALGVIPLGAIGEVLNGSRSHTILC